MQLVVRAAIESFSLSQVFDACSKLIQKPFKIASDSAPNGDDGYLIPLRVEPSDDVDGNTFSTTWAKHRNNLDYFYFFHDFSFAFGGSSLGRIETLYLLFFFTTTTNAGRNSCVALAWGRDHLRQFASRPCCRIALPANRRKTRSVFSFPR